MTLKKFCTALQQCAEALEEEAKSNINEFHNLFFGKNMNEVKLALERAKDYHFKEIADAASEILKNVKLIVFHQNQIEWLSNEANFSANDLKRFSYVKRQVYAFSNSEQKPEFSRSAENLTGLRVSKRERRRTASEISVGTLEAWEKYLDKKEKDETDLTENIVEVTKTVPKRTLSKARARKKFVSSTLGGFLDDDATKRRNLDSILEHVSSNEEDDYYDVPEGFEEESSGFSSITMENSDKSLAGENDNLGREDIEDSSEDVPKPDSLVKDNTDSSESLEENAITDSKKECSDLVDKINNLMAKEDLPNEIISNIFDTEDERDFSEEPIQNVKPRIVDVIYKKNPV